MKMWRRDLRRWLSMVLVCAMLLGNMQGLAVFALENEPPQAEEFTPEAEEEIEEPEEPEVPEANEPLPEEQEPIPEEPLPEVEQEPEEDEAEVLGEPEEVTMTAEEFREALAQLRALLEEYRAMDDSDSGKTDLGMQLQESWITLCIAYYGGYERVPFSGDYEDDGELSALQQALTEEERAEAEALLEEIFSLQAAASVQAIKPEGERPWFTDFPSGQYGSGSYNLNENDNHNRFFLEYLADYKTSAGVKRQNTFTVLVLKDEYLFVGSSIADSRFRSDKAEIVLTVEGKENLLQNTKDGVGYIKNRAQEKNGPRLTEADKEDTTRYIPHVWHNDTGKDQQVKVVFYAKSQTVLLGSPCKTTADFENIQGESTIAAWDITVVGKGAGDKYEVKSGRAWCKYLAMDTNDGANARGDLQVHVLTKDDYVYKVNVNEISPFGFIFFANNMGFTHFGNGYDQSIYHSFAAYNTDLSSMGTQGINVHDPSAQDTEAQYTHNIFFNAPSREARDALGAAKKQIEDITSVSFKGLYSGVAQYGHGGDFTFEVHGATSVQLTIDFSQMLNAMKAKDQADSFKKYMELYEGNSKRYNSGMGIVQLNTAVTEGKNTIYWDGKDVNGEYLPVGYYAVSGENNNATITIQADAKGGEVHFPMIDVEGIYGGLTIERLEDTGDDCYYVYYNNTPLQNFTYRTDQNKGNPVAITQPQNSYGSNFYKITDHTYTYKTGNAQYFNIGGTLSTLQPDGFSDTPVNSSNPQNTMLFTASGYNGGGNNSGIDVWTYYKPTTTTECTLSSGFAIMDNPALGEIEGSIFYDALGSDNKPNGKKDSGESGISGLQVRLVKADGTPVLHTVPLPVFDEYGNFQWDEDGNALEKETEIEFTAVTDVHGNYKFTGVYWGGSNDTGIGTDVNKAIEYYVQVEMNAVQRDTLQYVCTTSQSVRDIMGWGGQFPLTENNVTYAGDGNRVADNTQGSVKGVAYVLDSAGKYPLFIEPESIGELQKITVYVDKDDTNNIATAATIGYTSAIPEQYQSSYTVRKIWTDTNGNRVAPSVKELIVELYVSDENQAPEHLEGQGQNNRRGKLLERVILNDDTAVAPDPSKPTDKVWQHTWQVLDNRKQYYLVEYYYQVKEKHHANDSTVGNDDMEELDHQILIGATDVIFSSADGAGKHPYFDNSGEWYDDKTTALEKQTTIDTESLLFEMQYSLTEENGNKIITLKNTQTYDERAYYLWAGKDTVLPKFIGKTHLDSENNVMKFYPERSVVAEKVDNQDSYCIKGLMVQFVDGPEGQETFQKDEDVSTFFRVETENGQVKTDDSGNFNVIVKPSNRKRPVCGTYTFMASYNGHSWTLTLHIYDVKDGEVFHYSPLSKKEQMLVGSEEDLSGEMIRRDWIFANDSYRVTLKHDSVDKSMGTCADLVKVFCSTKEGLTPEELESSSDASVRSEIVSGASSTLIYRESSGDPGMQLKVEMTKQREERTNREEDHLDYTELFYQPIRGTDGKSYLTQPLYVYYKIVVLSEAAVHSKSDSAATYGLVNDPTDSSRGVAMYGCFKLEPIVAELTGATLSVGSAVDLNFYMDEIVTTDGSGATGETHSISEYAMSFILDGRQTDGISDGQVYQFYKEGTSLKLDASETGKGVDMYGYTFQNLNAYQMGDVVIGQLWLMETKALDDWVESETEYVLLDERAFSVAQYTKEMLAQEAEENSSVSQGLTGMLADMLNYGTEAQNYAVSNWGADPWPSKANAELPVGLKDRHLNAEITGTAYTQTGDTSLLTELSVQPVLQEGIQMGLRVNFKLADRNDWGNITVKLKAADYEEVELNSATFVPASGKALHVDVPCIGPFYWEKPIKLSFWKDESELYSLEYSVNSYCRNMSGSGDAALVNLTKAIFKYGESANAWLKTAPSWKEKIYGNVSPNVS